MSGQPINLDADPLDADWLRTTAWDLPTDPDEFVEVILGPEPLRRWLEFQRLPAFGAMPESLIREVSRRVESGPNGPRQG